MKKFSYKKTKRNIQRYIAVSVFRQFMRHAKDISASRMPFVLILAFAILSCTKETLPQPERCANVISYATHYTFSHKLIKRELSFDWQFCGELLQRMEGKKNDTLCRADGYTVLDYKIKTEIK